MYYNVIPNFDKGEAGMLRTCGDFPACQRGFKKTVRGRRTPTLREPCSEDHYSWICHFFNLLREADKQPDLQFNNSTMLKTYVHLTGAGSSCRILHKLKDLDLKCDQKQEANYPCHTFLFLTELIFAFLYLFLTHTSTNHTNKMHKQQANTCTFQSSRFIFNQCRHFLACMWPQTGFNLGSQMLREHLHVSK